MNRPEPSCRRVAVGARDSVASLVNCVLTSSHSTGTAVRSTGITRAVGHLRDQTVRRGQLDVAGGDQVLCHDHGLRVGRDTGTPWSTSQGHLRLGAVGVDRGDGADLHPGDADVVAGVDGRRGGEDTR